MHLRPRALGVVGEVGEVLVEVGERLGLDGAGALAQALPVLDRRNGLFTTPAERRREVAQSAAQLHVRQRLARVLVEGL